MKTIEIPVPEGHEASFDPQTGKVTFTPIEVKPKFWWADYGLPYAWINTAGEVKEGHNDWRGWVRHLHYNMFKTYADAEDVSRYQRVFNAVCRAVKQVDPDFVPDWGDSKECKYVPHWHDSRWKCSFYQTIHTLFPPVSTREKGQQVIDLLEAEGIVPVGVEK